jgi:hypothetical protein
MHQIPRVITMFILVFHVLLKLFEVCIECRILGKQSNNAQANLQNRSHTKEKTILGCIFHPGLLGIPYHS